MSPIFKAVCWAVAILCIALASALRFIPGKLATSLITVLPLVMVAIMASRPCIRAQAA
ncbi:hypothetical protein [Sphingopyxis sp. PET50]|uniref:hypothetical protein n=1 Tax=Sphingopyxis sp. PET50 TaxID=2976533 RepID=UPI0021B07BBA|nr:hypothetical protein [Sphingopyxis sp. PET50]